MCVPKQPRRFVNYKNGLVPSQPPPIAHIPSLESAPASQIASPAAATTGAAPPQPVPKHQQPCQHVALQPGCKVVQLSSDADPLQPALHQQASQIQQPLLGAAQPVSAAKATLVPSDAAAGSSSSSQQATEHSLLQEESDCAQPQPYNDGHNQMAANPASSHPAPLLRPAVMEAAESHHMLPSVMADPTPAASPTPPPSASNRGPGDAAFFPASVPVPKGNGQKRKVQQSWASVCGSSKQVKSW